MTGAMYNTYAHTIVVNSRSRDIIFMRCVATLWYSLIDHQDKKRKVVVFFCFCVNLRERKLNSFGSCLECKSVQESENKNITAVMHCLCYWQSILKYHLIDYTCIRVKFYGRTFPFVLGVTHKEHTTQLDRHFRKQFRLEFEIKVKMKNRFYSNTSAGIERKLWGLIITFLHVP